MTKVPTVRSGPSSTSLLRVSEGRFDHWRYGRNRAGKAPADWKPAGPRVTTRILAACDGQLSHNIRLRHEIRYRGSRTSRTQLPALRVGHQPKRRQCPATAPGAARRSALSSPDPRAARRPPTPRHLDTDSSARRTVLTRADTDRLPPLDSCPHPSLHGRDRPAKRPPPIPITHAVDHVRPEHPRCARASPVSSPQETGPFMPDTMIAQQLANWSPSPNQPPSARRRRRRTPWAAPAVRPAPGGREGHPRPGLPASMRPDRYGPVWAGPRIRGGEYRSCPNGP
ncbi:hypothetical protein QFZ75_001450 [Streptomyces sp. V3I8]|nr:hypothetical protein [Streptomyces sp. V3I8]